MGMAKHFQSSKNKKVCNVYTISLKKLEMKLMKTFFDAGKHQSFLATDFNTLDIRVFYNVTGMTIKRWRTWWWEWSNILKVIKLTSLQCLYSIFKKKLWMKLSIFDVSYHFWRKKPDMSKLPRQGRLLNLNNILRKSVATAFVFYCDAKHSDTLLALKIFIINPNS